MATFFGFAIADSMFPASCGANRRPLSADEVRETLKKGGVEMCLNLSHVPTIEAAKSRFNLAVTVPPKPPLVSLQKGDRVIVMSVRGLPRLEGRHEYTEEEVAKATFVFGEWTVTD